MLNDSDKTIMSQAVSYAVEADIKEFLDSVDHEKLVEHVTRRIADRAF